MKPLVSIIIPTFNRVHLLGETLESLINQTYNNWECIVVDDGSSDYTDELMEFYVGKDKRIQYHHRPENRPKGANACRNYGFELCKGDYINWLDSDDLFSVKKIEMQVELLNDAPPLSLVTCKWGRFSQKGNRDTIYEDFKVYKNFVSSEVFLNALADSMGYFPPHAYLISRALVYRAGPWLEYLMMNQDAEFMTRVVANSDRIFFSEEAIAFYRWREHINVSSYDKPEKVQNAINSWKLIEAYLEIRYRKSNFYFIKKAKERYYINVKSSFPELIQANSLFFKKEIASEPSKIRLAVYRLVKRIQKKISGGE